MGKVVIFVNDKITRFRSMTKLFLDGYKGEDNAAGAGAF
jgi:hypothetical protein